ncbi:branched-chain amino acid aminotransferase [Haloactinopolyspora alba]|uniref:Branched-chain amino acid aminotransferase n=1 Tax=Haloactinopolyspora alba TaxID=648780 RepID=A0A2P8DID4_9ACTN|nr:aminotransferase class IV [Haloactinopolyspora alba]PSK96958.1 branched-chain amino acid aminotransferase [Haloactinopolyspora alba]
MLIWLNGELIEESEARVSVFDHGLTVGDGVFETAKVVDGVPFALSRHIARLERSATGLGLPRPDAEIVRKACTEVAAQARGQAMHRLRITYTGGPSPLGSQRGDAGPTLVVAIAAAADMPATTPVAVVPWRRNERSAVTGLKTTSYGENVVALARAHAAGASEALFADTRDRLCEGTGSNVFVVVDGQALTPSLSSGCLAGVTRALVLEWTEATETDLDLDVLNSAEEIFLTSSTRDVQAVESVRGDTRRRDLPAPGPVTARIAATFAERSAADLDP